MGSVAERIRFARMAGVVGVIVLLASLCGQSVAQQPAERPTIVATIVLREKNNVTLNRGEQDGLRKGDKLRVSHFVNNRYFTTGAVEVVKVYGTTCIAKVTEQNGALGPEDTATFVPAASVPTSATPSRKVPAESARKPVQQPAPVPVANLTRKVPQETVPTVQTEPIRKPDPPLPLLPEFSADRVAGATFSFDYTNEGDKVLDTSAYRLSARLMFDGQDYRTIKTTLTGNYNLGPGKTQAFSFNLTDFTIAGDNDVWPLKSGRHTVVIRFGGKQYGPLTFAWHGDNGAK